MKLRLTREFIFQMAHALDAYDGKCRNIHGHNYRLLVTVEGTPIPDDGTPKQGMVMDFGDLQRIVEERIIAPFDHALVLHERSPYLEALRSIDSKLATTPFQPTCENLLLHFARLLDGAFPEGVSLHKLQIYETEKSCAELEL